jgi:nucleotide-binding universal stress UspA family protein
MSGIVLVPLDGSPHAERALALALTIAATPSRSLRLIHVTPGRSPAEAQHPDDRAFASRADAEAYLLAVLDRLDRPSDRLVTADVLHGDPTLVLLHEVTSPGPALIVLSTHGGGGPTGDFASARTRSLLAAAQGPWILLGPRSLPVESSGGRIGPAILSTILIALDGSSGAQTIVPHAVELARDLPNARITLLTVLESGEAASALDQPSRVASAHAYLDHLAARIRAAGTDVSQRVMASADVAGAILQAAELEEAHIIGMTFEASAGDRHFGPALQGVLLHSRFPVLACHAG